MIDEWSACHIERAEDIRDLFVPNFYFGCEADDPINALAFNTKINKFGARLKAIFSSDIGHWDVPDMTEVVEEAYELVEDHVITEEDFRDFVFVNPAELYAKTNPAFFKGTAVEGAVDKLMWPRSWDRPLYAFRGGFKGAGASSTDSKIAANIERGF